NGREVDRPERATPVLVPEEVDISSEPRHRLPVVADAPLDDAKLLVCENFESRVAEPLRKLEPALTRLHRFLRPAHESGGVGCAAQGPDHTPPIAKRPGPPFGLTRPFEAPV